MRMHYLLTGLLLGLAITACGGGGGSTQGTDTSSTGSGSPSNASPGGIWEGVTAAGEEIFGLVTEQGEFHFIGDFFGDQLTHYFGTLEVSGEQITADFTGITDVFSAFPDGSRSGTGTLSGTVRARDSLSAQSEFATRSLTNSIPLELRYNDIYERDSSLQIISGTYQEDPDDGTLTIDSQGRAFLQDPVTHCVIDGEVGIIDTDYNAYQVEFSYSSCTGPAAALNGAMFNGIATLYEDERATYLIVGATATINGEVVSGVYAFDRL